MRKLIAILSLLGMASTVQAQETRTAHFNVLYDLDAASTTYCVTTGLNGNPFATAAPGKGFIETSGSSATVTETTASEGPFASLAVGDILIGNVAGTTSYRVIIAKASSASVTVNAAVDWSASIPFSWLDTTCGTTVSDGWIDISGMSSVLATFQLDQYVGDGSGMDVSWQCRGANIGQAPVQVFPSNAAAAAVTHYTAAGLNARTSVQIAPGFTACRIGMLHTVGDDGNDLTTNTEQINAWISGFTQR